jgi:hypothetical protein
MKPLHLLPPNIKELKRLRFIYASSTQSNKKGHTHTHTHTHDSSTDVPIDDLRN